MEALLVLTGAMVALSAVLTAYGLRPEAWHARPARGAQETEPREETLGADLTASSPSQVRTAGRTLARLQAAGSAWRRATRAAVDWWALATAEHGPAVVTKLGADRTDRADRAPDPAGRDRTGEPDYRDPGPDAVSILDRAPRSDTRVGPEYRYSTRGRSPKYRRPSPNPANREYPYRRIVRHATLDIQPRHNRRRLTP